jgi:hypothetical protein
VVDTKPAQMVQVIQGAYYIISGLLVAFLVGTLQGPADHPQPGSNLWLVRIVALVAAGFGVALLISGLRKGRPFIGAGAGMIAALILLAQTSAGMALDVLPLTFLLDAAMELMFLVWWAATMISRVEAEFSRMSPRPV